MISEMQDQDCLTLRRKQLRLSSKVFGLDFVEVCSRLKQESDPTEFRLHFLGTKPRWLSSNSIIVCREGSDKPLAIQLKEMEGKQPSKDSISLAVVDKVCQDSAYTLSIRMPAIAISGEFETDDPAEDPRGLYFEDKPFKNHSAYRHEEGRFWLWRDEKKRWVVSPTIGVHAPGSWINAKGLFGDYVGAGTAPGKLQGEPISPTPDPFFDCLTFRFDHHKAADVDCIADHVPVQENSPAPDINYLAKDYATFRQLMLDRLAVTMPDWQERCPADIGIMLVEILAYSADHLSYYQDAVATEAYLGTARLRQSLRRHARLVDYRVHEGCNARTWVHCTVSNDSVAIDAKNLFFITKPKNDPRSSSEIPKRALEDFVRVNAKCQFFEPVVSKEFTFWKNHNECRIHDWGGATRCLPRGATSAFLVNPTIARPTQEKSANDHARPNESDSLKFKKGDVLVFEEIRGPWTGNAADANPTHRHAVRIISVDYDHRDELFQQDGDFQSLPLVKITWDEADALPFIFWISRPSGADWKEEGNTPISVVRGNMLLVDHGKSQRSDVNLKLEWEQPSGRNNTHYPDAGIRGKLRSPNLTFSNDLPSSKASAAEQLTQDPKQAVPQIVLQRKSNPRHILDKFSILELRDLRRIAKRLISEMELGVSTARQTRLPRTTQIAKQIQHACGCSQGPTTTNLMTGLAKLQDTIRDDMHDVWLPEYDLIDCGPDDARFVVEMSDDRLVHLRFGQRGFGRTPDLDEDPRLSEMSADYRIGNGTAGNIPAEAIGIWGSNGNSIDGIVSVRNPMPAVGGVEPETAKQIRLFAPHAIRTDLRRAITPEDYEKITMREFDQKLQRVKATFVWTGHEFEVLIVVDPRGREVATQDLLMQIKGKIKDYRRIGHSVRVRASERVVPTLQLRVCIGAHVIKEQVRSEMDRLFSDQVLADGSLGFFHPNKLTFGDGVYVSQIVAAATKVLGDRMTHIEVTGLHRRDEGPASELEEGVLPLWPQEIVRFDNDRKHPQFGTLELEIRGGR